MQNLTSYIASDGTKYHIPADKEAEFKADFGEDAQPAVRYRTKDGQGYTIPTSEIENFRVDFPDATPLRRVSFADGSTRDFTMPELSKFLRSKEWREGEQFKADREERDRAVNAKLGEDGEMHSPAWAGVKGALKGAALGAWEGGNAAANKIAKAIPEIGVSLESALGNALNLGGNAPNAVGNWFLADAASGKAWLDAKLPDQAKDWVGYEDWSTKTADKFADVSAMAYKFAPAMATGGSTSLVNTMFASDGINAASQTFDNAMQSGFTLGEANKAAAASFLVNFYGAKLMTRAGGVADNIANPLLRLAGGAAGVGTTMGVQNAANRGIENVTGGRPFAEGMGEAFEEGNIEGLMFHGINAIPGAVIKTGDRMRESREAKEYRRDSLLEVARGEDGGEFLNALLSSEGLDAAVRARKSGADVSRKIGERAGLPDNMSAAERNEIIDAIAKARGERAAQNAVKVDGFRSEALDASIKELGGDGEAAQDIRARVLRKIENARELDDPFRREELVGEAFEEWNKEHPKEKPDETGNVPDEKPAQPKPPVETRAEGPEAVRPVEGEPPRGEVPRPDVVKPAEKPTEPPQSSQEPPAPPKTGEDTPKPTEGVEAASRASDAKPVPDGKPRSDRDYLSKTADRLNYDEVIDTDTHSNSDMRAEYKARIGELTDEQARELADARRKERAADKKLKELLKGNDGDAIDAADKEWDAAVVELQSVESKLKITESDLIDRIEAKKTPPQKPVPDGKGKMVKPKAAESDYGVTMFEEPSVDGDGVRYVVKDGPSDAHRMMFKSKAEAESRLAKLRAERKAIQESPSATLADGKKIHLLKTKEGWVPYDENYVDLRRGVFNAAKTKAGAIKVAEKGVKWAKDVAEFNSAFKRFEEDFGLDEFNKKVGWGNENGEGWNESAALEHLRQFDLEKLKDMKERAKRFNLGHHNGRNEKIQEWFDKVISEKSPIPDGKGKMVKPAPTEPIDAKTDTRKILDANAVTANGERDKDPFLNKMYYDAKHNFAWKIVPGVGRNKARYHIYEPCVLRVLGNKRFGWREYILSDDGTTMREVDFKDFMTKEEAQAAFDTLIGRTSAKADAKDASAPTEPPKTTAPVVDETGKTAEVAPPDSVEAKISAMKRGSPEQLKAQKEYFETEIAKAEEAIKGKLDEPTKKKVGSKWVNEWKPKKDAGEVPPSVTIKIPGDGEFTVPNNPDGIARLKMVAAKFKAAPKKGKVETDSIPRGPSLKPAEKPKIESAEKETALFVSDGKREPLRKSVSKPFSDGEYVYATDGRMMVRRPLRKGEKVNGEKDAPIDATHKVIKEATANRENDTKLKASVSELYPKLIQAGVIADLRPDYLKKGAIQLWRGSDGKLQIRTRDDAGNEYFTDGLSKSSKPLAQIQGEYLQNFLKLVAKSGGGEIEISVKDAQSPLLLKGGGWDAVLMPLRTGDSPKSSPASKAKKPASDIQPQKPLAEVGGKNAEQAEFELPKQPPTPQNAARNPKALKDPNFVKWAKKHGRTPTPFARREYDRQKIEAAVPLYQRIFPGMKIKIHDKVEDPAKWTKDHPDGTLKLIRAKSGEVLGWYTPGFKELHLNPGATVETVAHEMLHAAQDWAKANSPELARALDNIARDCPRALKQRILRTYGAISPEAIMKEWGAFNFMGGEMGGKGKGGKAILDELARRENMTWAGKFWTAVKDIWKSMAAKMGGNRIDLSAIDSKTPQEAMDFLARAFAEGKTLGKMPKVGKTPRPAIDMTRKLTAKEKWEVNLHDYRDPLKVLLDDMVERGAKFDDSNNFYEASRLQKGFDQAAVNDANRRMAEYTKMCKEKGVTHDEVVEFMQAQAAKDRNAMILQRNGKLDGSAMSDKVAAKTLRAFEDAGKGDALREISDYLLAMQAEGLQYRVQTGLLSAEAAAEMTKREPKHVPFRSAIDPETGDYIEWGNDHGSFAKAEFQRAEGRQTLAGDVVSWMFDEFIDAHTRGNENTVRKMIADAMRLHPEMGVGKILKGARKTTAHDFQGVVSKVVNNGNKGLLGKKAKVAIVDDPNYRESRRNGDGGRTNVLAFKEGGEAHFIEFAPGERGSRIQAAVNGRDLKSMGKLWQKGMRFWSSTATELSPTFAVRNVIADNIDVFGNYVGEYGAIKGHAAYAKHVKNAAQLTPALIKYIATGKLPQGEMGEWIKRYEKAGGQIAGFANEGYNDIVKKIDIAAKSGKNKVATITKSVAMAAPNIVKGVNSFAELSTRIAAFKTQCELGMTDHKATLWSRESTVDFNMRGNWTGISNGLYMFSNSTLGASARQLKSLFSSRHGWEVAGTFFAYGFAEGALECLMNGDESEREKRGEGTGKDVNEYTRANSVYVRNGDKVYRVPFHAGPFSFIKYIGNCAARNAFGKMKLEDAGKEIGKEAVSQIFHYTGMGSVNFQSQSGKFADDAKTFIGTAVPSIGQNIVQGAFNIDYAGRSIYNEGFPGSTTPRSEQGRPSTPNWASDAAKWLNEKTGGNDARSGYVDLPPEVIKLAGEAVGKNLLRDVMNVGTVIGMTMGDEKVDVRNIPVARDFVRPVSGNDRRFNDALKEYNADTDEYSKKKSTWTREERIAYKKSHPWVDDKTKDTIDEIKKLRKREQGFWYKNGKAKPHEWTQEDLEKFKAKRQKLQAFVLEKMRK